MLKTVSFLTFLFLIFLSCSDSAPEINLLGNEDITLPLWQLYSEPGFTATDKEDGDITGKVTVLENFNYHKTGSYSITYNVTDSSDKTSQVSRALYIVIPDYKEILQKHSLSNYDTSALELNNAGFLIYKENEYYDAAVLFKAAVTKDNTLEVAHYNLACMLSLLEEKGDLSFTDDIFYHLAISLDLNPERINKILTDTDLDSIRDYPEYINLVERYQNFDISTFDFKKLISTNWDEYTYSENCYSSQGEWLVLNEDGTLYKQEPHEISKCTGNWIFFPESFKLSLSFDCSEDSLNDGSITTYSYDSEYTFSLSTLTIEDIYFMSNSPVEKAVDDNDLMLLKKYVHLGVNLADYNDIYRHVHDHNNLICIAIDNSNTDILSYLISQGVNINNKTRYDDNTYLHYAVMSEAITPEIIELLINSGVDINAQNKNGETALMLAESAGNTEIAEILRTAE
jgi:hypothetical protein